MRYLQKLSFKIKEMRAMRAVIFRQHAASIYGLVHMLCLRVKNLLEHF